jgi:DNA-directed RNA polymerase subunit RPC12/RpoP
MKIKYVCEKCGKEVLKNKFSYKKSGNLNLCTSCIRKRNLLEKYGVENVSQLKNHKEKMIKTNREKYGVDFYRQTQECQDRIKETNLEKYGVENVSQVKEFQDKIKETNLEKYGVENPMQNKDVCAKTQATLKEKYGGGPLTAPGAEEKRLTTIKERYGDDQTVFYSHPGTFVKDLKEYLKSKKMELMEDFPDNLSIYKIKGQIHIKCHCGDTYCMVSSKYLMVTTGCPKHYYTNTSKKELEVKDFIESLGFKTEKYIMKNKKHIDILVPEKNIGFEFDGLYWHSEEALISRQYNPISYHLEKTIQAQNEGIMLIHIFEDEWENKKEIVKNKIKNILGIIEKRIFARKTIIKEIDVKSKNDFLNLYHIQGESVSKINLGCFFENELIGVMTFSTPRISLGNRIKEDRTFELNRYASKYNIIGGASKLLSFFIKNYDPLFIYSYSDKRWSIGRLYLNIGFSFINTSKPNYWYFKNDFKRYHRFNFRKQLLENKLELFDNNKTEYENMLLNGWKRIWDCGNDKWIMKIKKASGSPGPVCETSRREVI